MKKQIGSIFLVAGTAIGAGMIALPMVLAKLGLILSIGLMFLIWILMYYTSLVSIELNLQAGEGKTLGQLGAYFSGPIAEAIGIISLKLLLYSLLCAYIYGATTITLKLLAENFGIIEPFWPICFLYTIALILLLTFSVKWVDYSNRLLFIGLLFILGILIGGLFLSLQPENLPLTPSKFDFSALHIAVPVVFTSFGFQVIFHTLTNYCHKDQISLKKIFFWGSLIPATVYILWTICTLGVLYNDDPIFYEKLRDGQVDVGDMIFALSKVSRTKSIETLTSWVSLLAILTSAIGVGLGLVDSWKLQLKKKIPNTILNSFLAVTLSFVPVFFVATIVPNAFITVLSFAGMILVPIAILLPIYLLYKAKKRSQHFYYPLLRSRGLQILAIGAGIAIIGFEIVNLFQ